MPTPRRAPLALAISGTVLLAGCGGGLTTAPSTVSFQETAPSSAKGARFFANLRNPVQKSNFVLAGLKDGVSQTELKRIETQHNAKVVRYMDSIRTAILQPLSGSVSAGGLASDLGRDPALEFADPEAIGSIAIGPTAGAKASDPLRGQQWALNTLEAEKAWTVTQGNPRTVIAVVDTGIDLNHPDLKSKLVPGVNVPEPDKKPMDDFGHGTHVAGIAAAVTDNGVGVAGLAAQARLMAIKVNAPKTGHVPEANVAAGIIWATDHGADVINLSLGYPPNMPLRTLKRALFHALSKKVVVVAAMGNEYEFSGPNSKALPAGWTETRSLSNIIAVGATEQQDKRASFSNTGSWISLSAPGYDILSTAPTYSVEMTGIKDQGIDFQLNYGTCSGTSMAAPYAAGLAALMLAGSANHEPALIKAKMQMTVDDLGAPGFDTEFGHGRINSFKAVK